MSKPHSLEYASLRRIAPGQVQVRLSGVLRGEECETSFTVPSSVANAAMSLLLANAWSEQLIESGDMGELLAHMMLDLVAADR